LETGQMERRAIDERNAAERINSDDSCTDAGEHRLGETAAFVELLIGRDELVTLLLELRGHAIEGACKGLEIARPPDSRDFGIEITTRNAAGGIEQAHNGRDDPVGEPQTQPDRR